MPDKPRIEVGTRCLYSPHECHALDVGFLPGGKGLAQLFRFAHAKAHGECRPGDPYHGPKLNALGQPDEKLAGREAPHFVTDHGRVIRHDGPHHYWPATVVAVNADGSVDLEVEHPLGGVTLHYPDRSERHVAAPRSDGSGHDLTPAAPHADAPGIRYDPKGKAPHTFHLPGD